MEHYYHICGTLLEAGSIILPGSYGHIVNKVYGRGLKDSLGTPEMLLYEERLEQYRCLHYPDKPSRFECVFVCHSIDNFKKFVKDSGRSFQFGYKVEVVGNITSVHYANWEKYDNKWTQANNWCDEMEDSVICYWSKNMEKHKNNPKYPLEILLPNKLKVIKRVI